jgi:hypothetical protein
MIGVARPTIDVEGASCFQPHKPAGPMAPSQFFWGVHSSHGAAFYGRPDDPPGSPVGARDWLGRVGFAQGETVR